MWSTRGAAERPVRPCQLLSRWLVPRPGIRLSLRPRPGCWRTRPACSRRRSSGDSIAEGAPWLVSHPQPSIRTSRSHQTAVAWPSPGPPSSCRRRISGCSTLTGARNRVSVLTHSPRRRRCGRRAVTGFCFERTASQPTSRYGRWSQTLAPCPSQSSARTNSGAPTGASSTMCSRPTGPPTATGSCITGLKATAATTSGPCRWRASAGSCPSPTVRYNEIQAEVSPDSRWVAYASDESGRFEIYAQTFPDATAGVKTTISVGGGLQPRWSADGRELYYVRPDGTLMAISVRTDGPRLSMGASTPLFQTTPPPP